MTSRAHERHVKRYNEYKTIVDEKRNACIRSILWLLDPSDDDLKGYPAFLKGARYEAPLQGSPVFLKEHMEDAFDDFLTAGRAKDAALNERLYAGMFMPDMPDTISDETMPCLQAWAAMVSCILQGGFCTKQYLKAIVQKIKASPSCASHHRSCPCKFPDHHFTHNDELVLLEPLGIKHRNDCECGGMVKGCLQVYDKRMAQCAAVLSPTELNRIQASIAGVEAAAAAKAKEKDALVANLLESDEAVSKCFLPEEGMSPFRVAALALADARGMTFEGWTAQMKLAQNRDRLDLAKKAKTDPQEVILADALASKVAAQTRLETGFNYSPDTGLEAAVMDNRKAVLRAIIKAANEVIALGS